MANFTVVILYNYITLNLSGILMYKILMCCMACKTEKKVIHLHTEA